MRILFVILAVFAAAACATREAVPPRSQEILFKGVELYSWQEPSGTWAFALLPGTNRAKSDEEIKNGALKGADPLKQRLSALAVGETVVWVWNRDGHALPPAALVDDLRAWAKRRGISLEGIPR